MPEVANVSVFGGSNSTNMAVGVLYQTTVLSGRGGWRPVDERLVLKARFRSYVPARPANEFVKAESALDAYGFAVLENDRGSGRETDAIRLLSATIPQATSKVDLYRLLPDWEGAPTTKDLPRSPESRYILDLSDEIEEVPEEFADELKSYGRELKDLGSQLVVMVTRRIWQRCRQKLGHVTATVPRRKASLVIRAHLAFHQSDSLPVLALGVVHNFVGELDEGGTSPDYAVKVADRLRSAQPADIERIIGELRKWRPHIEEQLDARQPGWADRRMLLISAAVLNGCPSPAVAFAARSLAKHLGHDDVPLFRALESEGWRSRLHEIGAKVEDDCTWVDRDKPGVDYAIFEWLWNEHPELREPVLLWMESLSGDPRTKKYVPRVIDVIAHVAGECRSGELLDALYTQLKGKRIEHRKLIEEAFERLLFHPAVGALTQERVWRWAYRGHPAAFPSIAALCGGRLGRDLPFVALARLRHLVVRADETEHHFVVAKALRGLVRDSQPRRLILQKVLSWAQDRLAYRSGILALLMLFDARCDDSVVTLITDDAAGDHEMFEWLVQAWDLLTSFEDQNRITDVTAGWSEKRDDGKINALVVAGVWEPSIRKLVNGPPDAPFFTAMTDATAAETLHFVLRRSATTRFDGPAKEREVDAAEPAAGVALWRMMPGPNGGVEEEAEDARADEVRMPRAVAEEVD